MSRTHFLVVSGKTTTDGIARAIVEDCVPKAEGLDVLASYGIVKSLSSNYGYEFHIGDDCYSYDSLQDGLTNHVSRFISAAKVSNESEEVNLFFLDNPYGENDYDQTVFNELVRIRDVENKGFDRLNIWHIVLAYDTKQPDNVVASSADDVISSLYKSNRDKTYTCFIGTKNVKGGATFEDTEHHDFHLPRMLADFMLLATDPTTSATLQQASVPSNKKTQIFSIGHSEYMYYAPEVKELNKLYLNGVLLDMKRFGVPKEISLDCDLTDLSYPDNLDFKKYPLGLKYRLDEDRYGTPEYSLPVKDININSKIDDTIVSSFAFLFGDKAPLGKLITREIVHQASIAYDEARARGTENKKAKTLADFSDKKRRYEGLLNYVSSSDFSEFLEKETCDKKAAADKLIDEKRTLEEEREGRGVWQRLCEIFSGANKRRQIKINDISSNITSLEERIELTDKAKIACKQIKAFCETKSLYNNLCNEVKDLERKSVQNTESINLFRLKSFEDTKNLVNLGKLHTFFKERKNDYTKGIYEEYKKKDSRGLASLNTTFEDFARKVMNEYEHINWSAPFIDFDTESAYKHMFKKALPYVHVSGTSGTSAFRNTQLFVSANNETYATRVSSISDSYQTLISGTMEDKICMIKVVSMTDEYVRGLLGESETAIPAEEITEESPRARALDGKKQLPPSCDWQEDIASPFDKIPPRQSQLGVGFRLIRELRFGDAKKFFATTGNDHTMAEVCTFLINSRRLIDAINNEGNGEMTEEDKSKIRFICEIFAHLGIVYEPLNNVVEKYLK